MVISRLSAYNPYCIEAWRPNLLMAKPTELTAESFENLLALFSSDRDEAGRQYEQLRAGLIRYFYFRGCSDGESLADETIARVSTKLDMYDPERAPRIASYVYGFASRVLLESKRSENRLMQLEEDPRIADEAASPTDEDSNRLDCLRECLRKKGQDNFDLIVQYYRGEGAERRSVRKAIGDREGVSAGALHTKVFRIKVELRKCIEKCLSRRKI